MSLNGVLRAGNPLIAVSYTPMEFLRSVRLRPVRDALLTPGQDDSVSQLEIRWVSLTLSVLALSNIAAVGKAAADAAVADIRKQLRQLDISLAPE